MAANARRYPVSAQCGILDVPRSTYYAIAGREGREQPPDPLEAEVAAIFEESRGRYGVRRVLAGFGEVRLAGRAKIHAEQRLRADYAFASILYHLPSIAKGVRAK